MSEPTLATDYEDLRSKVGFYLGYGRTSTAWTVDQLADIADVVKGGQRLVYNSGYDWGFLKPVTTLTLLSGTDTLALPDDYAQADGPIQVGIPGSQSYYQSMQLGPWQPVYQMGQRQPDTTGIPMYLCEEPLKGTQATQGQRMQLRVWPTADQDYTLTFAYRLNANAVTGNLPYLYGGSQHSELFLQACKAAAERDLDNIPATSPQAVHQPAFAQALQASIMMDRRSKPHTVGMQPPTGLQGNNTRRYMDRVLLPILVQGVLYD